MLLIYMYLLFCSVLKIFIKNLLKKKPAFMFIYNIIGGSA
jgi:hypothetical protein